MIVGGYALAYHGAPRYTGAIDVFVKPENKNAQRIMKVLEEFGFGSLELSTDDFQIEDSVVQLGLPPVRFDIITSISGVTWEQADASKVPGKFGDIPVFYIGKNNISQIKGQQAEPKISQTLKLWVKKIKNRQRDQQLRGIVFDEKYSDDVT